jgi:hypothetical protein
MQRQVAFISLSSNILGIYTQRAPVSRCLDILPVDILYRQIGSREGNLGLLGECLADRPIVVLQHCSSNLRNSIVQLAAELQELKTVLSRSLVEPDISSNSKLRLRLVFIVADDVPFLVHLLATEFIQRRPLQARQFIRIWLNRPIRGPRRNTRSQLWRFTGRAYEREKRIMDVNELTNKISVDMSHVPVVTHLNRSLTTTVFDKWKQCIYFVW